MITAKKLLDGKFHEELDDEEDAIPGGNAAAMYAQGNVDYEHQSRLE